MLTCGTSGVMVRASEKKEEKGNWDRQGCVGKPPLTCSCAKLFLACAPLVPATWTDGGRLQHMFDVAVDSSSTYLDRRMLCYSSLSRLAIQAVAPD